MAQQPKSLFLTGLPGSGKTTVGRLLSTRLGIPFIDLDDTIVASEGRPISQIFEENGEDYFRKVESSCLDKLLGHDARQIVSTGGGTPCFFDNADRMNRAGTTIYLQVPWSVLATRVAPEQTIRPLFKGLGSGSTEQSLIERFSWRLPYYNKAKLIIDTFGKAPETIVEEIISLL